MIYHPDWLKFYYKWQLGMISGAILASEIMRIENN